MAKIKTGAELLSDIRTRYLSDAEMEQLREYLLSEGATCVNQNSWYGDSGPYTISYGRESWTGPKGHVLHFTYAGPNPVGPQLHGWRVNTHASQCPEWVLEEVDRALTASRAQLTQTREIVEGVLAGWSNDLADWELELMVPSRSVTERDLGQPALAAAIAAAKVELDANTTDAERLLSLIS